MIRFIKEQKLTFGIFITSSLLIVLGVYVGIPFFTEKFNWSFGEAYLLCFYTPFALLFFGHLVIYKIGGNVFTWEEYSKNLRLIKFNKKTLKILVLSLIIIALGFLIASELGKIISDNIPFLQVPESFPAGLNHNKPMVEGYFFDVYLPGNWTFASLYLLGWFFNIFGEELMFRGLLLPKNELSFPKYAWLFQGVLWGVWHVFWFWQFIPITIFVAIPFLYVVQKSKNTWSGIIIHGLLNLIPFVMIIIGVIGF